MQESRTKTIEEEWTTTSFFRESWLATIKQHRNRLIPLKTIQDNKVWFECLFNEKEPVKSTYRCRLCHKYFDTFKMDKRYKPSLASETGVLKNDYEKNREMIANHGKQSQHQEIIRKLEVQAVDKLPQQFQQIQDKKEQENAWYFAVTMRMIRTVHVETKINLPLDSHSKIVQLQAANGLSMGHHHLERTSATRMMMLISLDMHKTLIRSVCSKKLPISIIVDSSTDASQNHYLIVYFQRIENDVPVIYFYKLIKLAADESAAGLFRAIENQITSDGPAFTNNVKENLIGFASDGASVMMGSHNGLKVLINNWATKNIYVKHCMAHRLNLVIRSAMKTVSYYKTFEETIISVHNFYNHHGHKRKGHLKELAAVLELRAYEIPNTFQARWIASEYHVINNLNQSWHLIVTDLEEISIDASFTQDTKAQAKGLYQKLKNKNFLLILQFTCDITDILSHWSKRLQQRSGVLVGAEQYRNQMIQSFEEMKQKTGRFLTFFLDTVICSDSLRKWSYSTYDSSLVVCWQNIDLLPKSRVPDLENIRVKLLDELKHEIESYFPEGDLSDFDIFLPKKFHLQKVRCFCMASVKYAHSHLDSDCQ